jgi:hypothetical protein
LKIQKSNERIITILLWFHFSSTINLYYLKIDKITRAFSNVSFCFRKEILNWLTNFDKINLSMLFNMILNRKQKLNYFWFLFCWARIRFFELKFLIFLNYILKIIFCFLLEVRKYIVYFWWSFHYKASNQYIQMINIF